MINKPQLNSYSLALAEKISSEFFSDKNEISGKEIIILTSINQLNLFIIRNLFDRWKDEEEKLKSPYFDYDNSEVKDALKNLLNKLSNNILIKKEFFKPLLNKAIYDTLYYALEPKEYLIEYLSSRDFTNAQQIKDQKRFHKINRELYVQLIEKAELSKEPFSANDIELLIKDLPSQSVNSETEKTLDEFSSLLAIEFDHIGIKPKVETPSPHINLEQKEEEAKPTETFSNPAIEEEIEVMPKTGSNITEKPLINEDKQTPTLNDQFRKEERTLLDYHRKNTINDVRKAVSLNQRFLFTNALFEGNAEDFEESLALIEASSSAQNAMDALHEKFADKYHWNYESDAAKDFVALINLRFEN
ncbi:MAG: hypothetical protein ACK4ND_17705 [Cytophagaceae bacterium]